jgi:hypothetical protein
LAYGRLGWSEKKFFKSTPDYFFNALKGFNDLEFERQKSEWERLRILGAWILSPHSKKGSNLTPKKLMPLPWDKSFSEENKDILELAKDIAKRHGEPN